MELWKELEKIKKRIFEGEDVKTIKEELSVLKERIGEEDFEKVMHLINKSIMQTKKDHTETILYLKELNDLEETAKNRYSPITQEYLRMRSIVQKKQPHF